MQDVRPLEPAPSRSPAIRPRNAWLSVSRGAALLLLAGLAGCGETGAAADAAVETRAFVSSAEGLKAELAEDYTPFSFNYPASWKIVENGSEPDDNFYVRMVRSKGDKVAESFLVGSMVNRPDAVQDPTVLRPMVDEIGAQLADFRLVKTGPQTLGGNPGLQFTFTATTEGSEVWGRGILLPGQDGRGLWLVMVANSLADSVEGPAHVGERGQLPVILKSFKMGPQ